MGKPNLIREVKEAQVDYVGPMRIKLTNPSLAMSLWVALCSYLNFVTHLCMSIALSMCLGDIVAQVTKSGLNLILNRHLHAVSCISGSQFFIAEGILCLNYYNAWSAHLTPIHRRRTHWILQITGSMCMLHGTYVVYRRRPGYVSWSSRHGCFGLLSAAFTLLSLLNGVCALYSYKGCNRLWKLFHAISGISAMFFSTVSFYYSFDITFRVFEIPFQRKTVIYFFFFYVIGILVLPLSRLLRR